MDMSSLIGLALGLIGVFVGMVVKGADLAVLVNPAAFLIIIVGTLGACTIAMPGAVTKKVPKYIGLCFMNKNHYSKPDTVMKFLELALISRKEGLLALESHMEEISDEFLKKGLSLVIDGSAPDIVEKILSDEIQFMETRHKMGITWFNQAGTYAPTLGVLGAVIGLIAALANMNDIDKLGHAISAAFVATLLGIFTGYVLAHPTSNKLKMFSQEEVELKEMVLEGVLCIQKGISPAFIEQTMLCRLSTEEKKKYESMKGKDQ